MSKNISIIGGGNMGEALIKGLYKTHKIHVCESDAKRVRHLKTKYRVCADDLHGVLKHAGVVVLAVKPQDMLKVLQDIKQAQDCCAGGGQIFISIAAGLTTKFFETHLGGKTKVVRAMPNMPALIGEGITALCVGRYASTKDLLAARAILSSVGETLIVDEKWMDAVTAVSGSGPAYVFLFVEQWMAATQALGFKEEQAKLLVYATLVGSAHLLKKSTFKASDLRAKVTSKGGTTQAAMDVFFKGKLDQLMKQAVSAAQKRAKELAL